MGYKKRIFGVFGLTAMLGGMSIGCNSSSSKDVGAKEKATVENRVDSPSESQMLSSLKNIGAIRIESASNNEISWWATAYSLPSTLQLNRVKSQNFKNVTLDKTLEKRAINEISKYLDDLPGKERRAVAPGYYIYITGKFYEVKIEGYSDALLKSLTEDK